MADPEQINADQLAFWSGPGGHNWVARQEHTDITLAGVPRELPSSRGFPCLLAIARLNPSSL